MQFAANNTDSGAHFLGTLSADGATNAQLASLSLFGGNFTTGQSTVVRGTSAEDSTTTLTLTITGQFSTAATGVTYTMEHATLELM